MVQLVGSAGRAARKHPPCEPAHLIYPPHAQGGVVRRCRPLQQLLQRAQQASECLAVQDQQAHVCGVGARVWVCEGGCCKHAADVGAGERAGPWGEGMQAHAARRGGGAQGRPGRLAAHQWPPPPSPCEARCAAARARQSRRWGPGAPSPVRQGGGGGGGEARRKWAHRRRGMMRPHPPPPCSHPPTAAHLAACAQHRALPPLHHVERVPLFPCRHQRLPRRRRQRRER